MKDRNWAVDVEGSGSSPPEIVELAIAEMDGLELTGRTMQWRFKPKQPISPIVSRIHGIWDRDVADAPEIEDVADDLIEWLEDRPIVGHNVRTEHEILARSLDGWAPAKAIDTLRIARRLLPNEEKHGLERLGSLLNLNEAAAARSQGRGPHSALFDAVLAALLMRKLLTPLSEQAREMALLDADILRGQQDSFL